MIRKLIQLSPSTSVVSLPHRWVEANKLKRGAELHVAEEDNKVIIAASGKKTAAETTIDISKLPDRLMWLGIGAAYVKGYDSIIVHTGSDAQTAFMTKVVRYYPGMILLEERPRKVVLKDMGTDTTIEIDKILSRIFNLTIAVIEDGITAAKAKNWVALQDAKRRDYTINSYIYYIGRQMNKFGHSPATTAGSMHTYTHLLEMIADKLCALLVGIGEKEIEMTSEIHILEKILDLYRKIPHLHFGYTTEKLVAFEQDRGRLLKSLPKIHVHLKVYFVEILELLFDLEEIEMEIHA